jgi:hypothetical protein
MIHQFPGLCVFVGFTPLDAVLFLQFPAGTLFPEATYLKVGLLRL